METLIELSPEQLEKVESQVSHSKWSDKVHSLTEQPFTESERFAICVSTISGNDVVDVDGKSLMVSCSEDSKLCECTVEEVSTEMVSSSISFKANPERLESLSFDPDQIALIRSKVTGKRNEDGTFTVMAGMEGQRAQNSITKRISTYSRAFFEKNHTGFVDTFYYPNHESAGDVSKRLARVVRSSIEDIGSKLVMFHDIDPKTEQIASEIDREFFDDVSIDVIKAVTSSNVILDGVPYGTAFVAAPKDAKGCPDCHVIHSSSDSCNTTDESPGSSVESRQSKPKHTEVENLTETDENSGTPPGTSEITEDVSSTMVSKEEFVKLQSKIEDLEFGTSLESLVEEVGIEKVDKGMMMSIVSSDNTPQARLETLQSLVESFTAEKKAILESKITTDPNQADGGLEPPKPGEMTQSEIDANIAKLTGTPIKKVVK